MGHDPSGAVKLGFVVLLFGAVLALRLVSASDDATLVLFVVPIAICGLEFGLRGGLGAAVAGIVLLLGWEVANWDLGALGLTTRAIAYLLVGVLVGRFVDERRSLTERVDRHYELSRDLFGTANFEGYFEELNPAWEQALGYTTAELRSRPFIQFVHPEDRERTDAETAKLAQGIHTVSFRNRYRTAQGEYRWLEWNVRPVDDERRLYATARDITLQHEAEEALKNQSEILEQRVRERTQALEESRLETLKRLAVAAEYRDDDTHQHTERVGRTAAMIANSLGLPSETIAVIRRAAPLHDIGKVGIPDAVLLKPGRLTAEEFEAMQEHVTIGAKILAEGRFAVVRFARVIALSHHERWDGTGYPQGLRGEEIPIAGRLVAVADVFDALTHERPYKRAWSVDEAVEEIRQLAGTHFDPQVVEAFETLDHERLVGPAQEYDLGLPAPPLVPTDAE
jgi:PAS domain S-box-containing protein/putative nucleotidyltransferase with HDIG domain